jgi:hypothetical protein
VRFYVSAGDIDTTAREMYRNNRVGFGAKRIPRKAKKRLLREWQRWQWNPKAWR